MTTIKGTNWSNPKTNIIAGINDLRRALASGCKAKLIRALNEECNYPIRVKEPDKNFRHYRHSIGYASSINKIKEDPNLNEFEKYLTLNYVSCFGTEEAVKRYYETGICSKENFNGMGRAHLVNVDDLIKFLKNSKEYERANMYERQYRSPEHVNDVSHFFDFYRYDAGCPYSIKKFKTKLWVVMLQETQPKLPVLARILITIINVLVYPLKWIPRKSVLRMPEYTLYTFRIGSVTHGYEVEFQIPKKFSFA
jgi:hypothetical protein